MEIFTRRFVLFASAGALAACSSRLEPTAAPAPAARSAAVSPTATPRPIVGSTSKDAGGPSTRPMWTPPGTEDRDLHVESLGTLRVGSRVRLTKRDRALDPEETGHATRVAYGPGQEGVIVRFVHRRIARLDAEFDVAVVRWEPQEWYEWDAPITRMTPGKAYTGEDIRRMNEQLGRPVRLESFEAAAHPELLRMAAEDGVADGGAPAPRAGGKPKRSHCAPPLRAMPGVYVVFVRDADRVEEIAEDLARRHDAKIRRVWPALASFSVSASPAQLSVLADDERLREISDNCM